MLFPITSADFGGNFVRYFSLAEVLNALLLGLIHYFRTNLGLKRFFLKMVPYTGLKIVIGWEKKEQFFVNVFVINIRNLNPNLNI